MAEPASRSNIHSQKSQFSKVSNYNDSAQTFDRDREQQGRLNDQDDEHSSVEQGRFGRMIESYHAIEDRVGPALKSSKVAIQKASNSATQWAKRNPISATLAVAGVGLLIGWMAKRLMSAKED